LSRFQYENKVKKIGTSRGKYQIMSFERAIPKIGGQVASCSITPEVVRSDYCPAREKNQRNNKKKSLTAKAQKSRRTKEELKNGEKKECL